MELELPAGIGERVLIRAGEFAGQTALVIAWHADRPRFLLGGAPDGDLRITLVVITERGEAGRVDAAEVIGLGHPAAVSVFLPFTRGDAVLVAPTWVPGEIRGWEIIGRRLETVVHYRVHLDGAPAEDEMKVDAVLLEPRPSTPRAGTR
jgi:hypothetical protein